HGSPLAGDFARVRRLGDHRYVLRDLPRTPGFAARSDHGTPLRIRGITMKFALSLALLIATTGTALAQADPRVFPETGYSITDDAIWSFFTQYGGQSTFGEPVSREFLLMGTPVQLFQNAALQIQSDGSVQPM